MTSDSESVLSGPLTTNAIGICPAFSSGYLRNIRGRSDLSINSSNL